MPRCAWYELEGQERPVLKEVVALYHLGLAGLERRRIETPLALQAARLLYRGPPTDRPFRLIEALLDRLFAEDDSTWIHGQPQRNAASFLIGHADKTRGMPFEERREKVADLHNQHPDTFRRPDRGGAEAPLLREIARAIESVIETYDSRITDTSPRRDDPSFIQRDSEISAIRSSLTSGSQIICIWGESGTGKTILAEQVGRMLANGRLVTKLRTADPDVLRGDIVEALIAEGMEPTNWSDSYCRSMLRRALAELPRCGLVILDNVDDEEHIWQLMPEQPKVPVIITMRNEPQSTAIERFKLSDFTEAQACAFIRSYLDDPDEKETLALARVLGCRPLALDLAVRFIRQSSAVTMRELIMKLVTSVTEGLDLVTSPSDRARNLVNLYKIILASVVADDAARHLLDSFLAIAGKGAMEARKLLYFFMQSELGGSSDVVRCESGLRALAVRGLLRTEPFPARSFSDVLLVMHPLTYEILRDLRTPIPFEVEYRFVEFLQSEEAAKGRPGTIDVDPGSATAWIRQQELFIVSKLKLPGGWKNFFTVDETTFVAVRQQTGEGHDGSEYIVRYEVIPDIAIYKLDYRTGKRSIPDVTEAVQLFQVAQLAAKATLRFLEEVQAQFSEDADPGEENSLETDRKLSDIEERIPGNE